MISEIAKWLLIVVGGLVGFAILYIIGWQVAVSVAPDAVEKYNLRFVVKDIKKYFGFLLDKGYAISNMQYFEEFFGNWIVTLESQKCKIYISQDRSEVMVSLAPLKAHERDEFSLEAMIYFVTKGQKLIGFSKANKKKRFEHLASLLKEYHDQIVPYLDNENYWESDFGKYKNELMATQRQWYHLLMEKYLQRPTKNKRVL